MTLDEAKAIGKRLEENGMIFGIPYRTFHNDGTPYLALEVEGWFSAEEFEAMAAIVRAASSGKEPK